MLIFIIEISALLGLPKTVALVVAAVAVFAAPFALAQHITRGWDRELPGIVAAHPVRFLRKVRDLRYSGYIIQVMAIAILLLYLVRQPEVPNLLVQTPLLVAFVYFFIIELVLLQVALNFWRPNPLVSLRACLLAEEDAEKTGRESWLDDALDYFNLLKEKDFVLGIRDELSLDALLLGSSLRRLHASFLLRDVDSGNYVGFVNDLAIIAHKPVSEIVGRVGFGENIRKNQWTMLSIVLPIVVVLATNPSVLHTIADPIINSWSNLLKSLR